jgi:hypothetical protein
VFLDDDGDPVRQPCLAVKLKDLLLLRSPDNALSGPPAAVARSFSFRYAKT